MRISARDLVPDFLEFEREATTPGSADLRSIWEQRYAARHADVFERYLQMGEPPDLDEVLAHLLGSGELYLDRSRRVAELTRLYAPKVAELLGAEVGELSYVTMVGLFRADGFVDDLAGTPTAFFAVEQFQAPPWDETHVVHEMTHLVHAAVQPEPWSDEVIGLRLLLEGLAIATTHALLPHLREWTHYNFPPAEIDGWLRACEEAWPRVTERLLELVSVSNPEEERRYFWPDWARTTRDVPAKVGYFVGARVVERLAREMSLADLAKLPPADAVHRAAEALAASHG